MRDKDTVDVAFMICEMFAFYKSISVSLLNKLTELYATYCYCLDTFHSYEFDGSAVMQKMKEIMVSFHKGLDEFANQQVERTEDYSVVLNGLLRSDVLKYFTSSASVIVRQSSTGAELKTYSGIIAKNKNCC